MRHIWRRVAARFEVTDEEHVQGIRRTVAFYDRWRRPLLALYVAAAVAFAVMFVAAVSLLQGLVQWANMQGLIPGFVVGLALGMMLGGLTVHITHGLLFWLAPPLRTERMLLRHYDVLTELAQGKCGADRPKHLNRGEEIDG